ncbi:MAG: hypothetical protein KF812_01860 [Fimbriimonadaceae bacterium]|nr:hypothetical protein [Fimbriimonadaceae bacterium]
MKSQNGYGGNSSPARRTSRASKLWIAAFVALIIGCGGSGGPNGSSGGTTGDLSRAVVDTTVTMPSGHTAESMDKISAWTSAAEMPLSPSGTVGIEIFGSGPQFSQLLDSQDRVVLSGFVGSNRKALDSSTTAETLAYFALGGPLHRGDARITFLNTVKDLSGFAGLVTAVETALKTDGHVTAENAGIQSALQTMRSAYGANRSATSRSVTIEPGRTASGLLLDDSKEDQVTVTNSHARRAYYWLQRIGFKDKNGDKVTFNTPTSISEGWVRMPSRYGGEVDGASGLMNRQYEWAPVSSDPMQVLADAPGYDGEQETYYKLITVGAGKDPGDFNKLTTAQSIKWEETIYSSAYLDFYVPIFANMVLPLSGADMDALVEYISNDSRAKAYMTECRTLMPTVASEGAKGNYPGAVSAFVRSSNTATRTTPMTVDIVLAWGMSKGFSLFKDKQDLLSRVDNAEKRIGNYDLVQFLTDFAPFSDVADSNLANIFDITSSKGEVTLTPEQSTVGIVDTPDIFATIKNKQEGVEYEYVWTVNSDYFLMDGDANSTDKSPNGVLISKYDKVFIGSLVNTEGTAAINCTVRVKGGATIGKDTTSIIFKKNISVYTGTFEVIGAVIPNQKPGEPGYASGFIMYVIAVVPTKEKAFYYSGEAVQPDGKTFKTASWYSTNPYLLPHEGLRAAWESDKHDYFLIRSSNGFGYSSDAAAEAALNELITGTKPYYADWKVKVTATLNP